MASSSSPPPRSLVPETVEDFIELYTSPGHPIAYAGLTKIYKHFKGRLSKSFIQNALNHIDAYTLHREYKRPKVFNPYYAYIRRKNFQADLISMLELKQDNDGYGYLNLIIDIFTRKVWIVPQKDKSANTTAQAMTNWLDSIENDSHPNKQIFTDRGREYTAAAVQTVFRSFGVKHDTTQNVLKASIAERCVKSIEVLIYKYLTDKGETRYIDVLPAIVKGYNNRNHRSLGGHSPNFADKKTNEIYIRGLHASRFAQRHKKGGRKPKLAMGDKVRVKTYPTTGISTVRRAYLQQFKGELFEITAINRTLPVPLYTIRSMDSEDTIQGGFYSNELQKIAGDTFKIEKVLRRRGRGENEEYFVKWKYFSPRWNSWVKKSDLVL